MALYRLKKENLNALNNMKKEGNLNALAMTSNRRKQLMGRRK